MSQTILNVPSVIVSAPSEVRYPLGTKVVIPNPQQKTNVCRAVVSEVLPLPAGIPSPKRQYRVTLSAEESIWGILRGGNNNTTPNPSIIVEEGDILGLVGPNKKMW